MNLTHREFETHINQLRKSNKNKWFFWEGTVNGLPVKVKGFETWLQIFRVGGINHSTTMDLSVKEFRTVLRHPFAADEMERAAQGE